MKRIMIKIAYDGTNYNGWQTGGTNIGIEDIINHTIKFFKTQFFQLHFLFYL